MTTLANDSPRAFEPEGTDISDLPVIASDIIYAGAAVGDNGSGYARPLQAGDPFRGFALSKADNSASATAGAINVRVRHQGYAQLAVASVAITDVGKPVFASDDDTFVLTQGSNTCIGSVHRWLSTGVCIVRFNAASNVLTELTDNTTGAASDTLASITDAATKNAIASLAAKVNSLIRRAGS